MFDRIGFHGSNLRVARDYCGLTLEDVGNRVNVKKQYVQQLEAGKRQPSIEVVSALAVALGFPPGFFARQLRNKVETNQCYYRRLKSIFNYHLDRYSAFATLFADLLEYLDERLGLPPYDVPKFTVKTDGDIEAAADACRLHWGIPANAPIKSMTRVLEAAGVPIASVTGISDKLDAFSWNKGRCLVIRSIDKRSGTRSRFDLAHELGHLVMHASEKPGDEYVEEQASRFAGAFLAPQQAFRNEYPKSGWLDWSQLLQLKARWGISLQAIIHRASDLSLIDAARYHWACVDLSCRGWKRSEPDEFKIEESELIPRAFELLRSGQRMTPQQVALQLDLEPAILARIAGIPIPCIALAT